MMQIRRNSPEHGAAYAEIARLHIEYQQAYSDSAAASRSVAREAQFKAGRVHRDGRPVTLNNGGLAETASLELARARAALETAQEEFRLRYELVEQG